MVTSLGVDDLVDECVLTDPQTLAWVVAELVSRGAQEIVEVEHDAGSLLGRRWSVPAPPAHRTVVGADRNVVPAVAPLVGASPGRDRRQPLPGGWPISASWTDGPAGSTNVSNTKTHRYFVYSTDVALTLSLPASATPHTAILYLGGYRTRGRLEVSFDDTPANMTSDERENQGYYYATRYEIHYTGGPATTKLVVRWKMMTVYEATGTIIIASVALR